MPPEGQRPPESPKRPDLGGLYHGLQFAVTIAVCFGIGYWLDGRYLPAPLGTIVGFLGGAVLGMVQLARAVK